MPKVTDYRFFQDDENGPIFVYLELAVA